MPVFVYKAINESGQTITGEMEAGTAGAVSEQLSGQNYMPLKITEKKSGGGLNLSALNFGGNKVKPEEIINFTKYLVTLLRAGVPIISALSSLRDQAENKVLKDILQSVTDDVEGGANLSMALKKHPSAFDGLYVNSVKAGETGGVLDQVLMRIAALMAYEQDIRSRVKGAIRYPLIVIGGIVVGFSVLMVLVVPQFVDLFASSGVELPMPTRILIGISTFLQSFWWLLLLLIAGGAIGMMQYVGTTTGQYKWDKSKLSVPVLVRCF
jgi:type II secretory pathway component PulF